MSTNNIISNINDNLFDKDYIYNNLNYNMRKQSYTIYDEIYENNMDKIYYRLFNFNNDEDMILINGEIPLIMNVPNKLNEILSIDNNNCSMINIPMIKKLYIKYKKEELTIDIKDGIYWNNIKNDNIYILPLRNNNNMSYQDIIINTSNGIISITIYKLHKSINNINYGIVLLYKSYNNLDNQPSTIFFTKKSNNYLIKNLIDESFIKNINNKILYY
jgi:hypothetical protein